MFEELRARVFEAAIPGVAFPSARTWIGLVASARGLRLVGWSMPSCKAAEGLIREYYGDVPLVPDDRFLLDVARQIQAYLAGERHAFRVDLDLRGHTPFALSVWAAVARIEYGQTRTYGWIADQVGGTGAAQAVGAAVGANPVPLIIPCHRVIGSDGSLHGYAGGLDMKAWLLAMESGQGRLALDLG